MSLRIVITTTLNDNLFHAKLLPLVHSRPDVEVVVVSDREGPPFERVRWVWPKGAVRRLGRLGARLFLLARELARPQTRLVMAYNVLPHGFFAILLGKLRRLPVFLHFISGSAEVSFAHNVLLSGNRMVLKSRNPKRLEALANWTARRADRIFVPGSNTRRELIALGYPAEKIRELHSTIDPVRYFPGNSDRDIDVLIAAQVRERKRPLLTLEVFRRILDARPGTRFCWLGDGPMHDEFDAAIDRLGLRESLLWTETNDVAPFYRRAKVFLLCSIREGLSLASMEAMGCGVVPVSTDCGDMSDVVRTGEIGALLPIEATEEQFAAAVLPFLNDAALWERHSRAASRIIETEHSFPIAEAAWQQTLAPLARSFGQPAR